MERPIFWHQGLLLQPQHFQIENNFFQSLLYPLQKKLMPYFWGISSFKIQESSIQNGEFELERGDFLFQDMTYVNYPENAVIQSRSFEDSWKDRDTPLEIFIGLKKQSKVSPNVTQQKTLDIATDIQTRFLTREDPESAKDIHTDGPDAQLKRLHYVLNIFWNTEKKHLDDYLLIPIGKLEVHGGDIFFAKKYIPPMLSFNSSDILLNKLKEIRDNLKSKSRVLEAYKRKRGIHTASFGSRDMLFLLALRSLNRYIPVLYHWTESKQVSVHPWNVYGLLRQLIGELSSFSNTVNVIGENDTDETSLIKPYDHLKIWDCFSGASNLISTLLDEITSGPDFIFSLDYDETYYSSELPPKIFEGHNKYYLSIESKEMNPSVLQSLESLAKLSARESLSVIIASALPGVRLEHIQVPPQELPNIAHAEYYRIDHLSDQWQDVTDNKNIALFWNQAPEDIKIQLMVVGG